ncbi:MAG: hypothetical protein C4523_07610 [Myxococcales bacterium]|nr:MAG: hypothetical protein C4523_07610 [Myxococcales bacterium]
MILKISVAALAAAAVLPALMLSGCNDHRFTPVASIEVYPDVINYEIQRKDQLREQILVTNKAVSANLELFETAFEDSVGNLLLDEDDVAFDQSILMRNLQETKRRDGSAIVYASFPGGIVSDVTCEDDSFCHCVPQNAGDCTFGEGLAKEQLGAAFVCEESPIDPNLVQSVCVANFKYFNNAGLNYADGGDRGGKVQKATWGGPETFTCAENTDCARLGPEYLCLADGVCGSDIKLSFSLEYGLEQLVAVDTAGVDTAKAATWTSIDGRELCLKKDDGAIVSDVTFYGLNRCDQIALKQELNRIDDGDTATSYRLYPKRQANFRVLYSPVEAGQSRFVVYCDDQENVPGDRLLLKDTVQIAETCLTDAGDVKSDLLSIAVGDVRLDQLPVRVLYSPATDYPSAAVLSGKSFTMHLTNSALVGGSNVRNVSLILPENKGCPPIPVIEIPEDQQNPEPLSQIHLDGRNSTSPFGEERKPFQYWWEWAPNGKPVFAQDAVLIESTGSFDNPVSIMNQWTSEGYPKIYFPIAGLYCIRLKVKDSAGVESGPTTDCPLSPVYDEICIDVKPSQKLHVELIWDRGDSVDLDLFLVRYRDDGTFAVPSAFQNRIKADDPVASQCTEASECYGGAFQCGANGFCDLSCASDADCKAANGGWTCNEFGQCVVTAQKEIDCDHDADCPDGGFCNPRYTATGAKMICTQNDYEAVNDTCYFTNGSPRWGEYGPIETACPNSTICNGVNQEQFECIGGFCDYACDNSNQCLEASQAYLCGESGECVGNNPDDDPTLDIDDVDGWGPENISLKEPSTGKYRIVARLYADPKAVVSDATPNSPVKGFVQIYLNGELALSRGIAHEFAETSTYWKVADVEWDSTANSGEGSGTVDPICAGWTVTKCNTTENCVEWFDDEYACESHEWGKFCSTCTTGTGAPDECNPTIPCNSDNDCVAETTSKICTAIKGDYCRCSGVNEFGQFSSDPYANPFIKTTGSGIFDPSSTTEPRSIWCDKAQDLYNATDSCSSLYQP